MADTSNHEAKQVDYPKLPPRPFASLKPEEYIDQRLNQALSWYDNKSVVCKNRYLRMRAFSVGGAALVPVLVNLNFRYDFFFVIVDTTFVTTVFSIVVALLVSLESVYHYREQWVNYRTSLLSG